MISKVQCFVTRQHLYDTQDVLTKYNFISAFRYSLIYEVSNRNNSLTLSFGGGGGAWGKHQIWRSEMGIESIAKNNILTSGENISKMPYWEQLFAFLFFLPAVTSLIF